MFTLATRKLICTVVVVYGLQRLWKIYRLRRKGLRSLPGPVGIPVLGNVFDVSPKGAHLTYDKLAKRFGPIFQLQISNKTFVMVASTKVAAELLDKRGAIYSDRPVFPAIELAGWGWAAVFMKHNDAWRTRRRLLQRHFNPTATAKLHEIIHRGALELALSLTRTPDEFQYHIKRAAAADILRAVYGFSIDLDNDPYVELACKGMETLNAVVPGSNVVDWIPLLRHIPEWIPGAPKARGRALRQYSDAVLERPYEHVIEDMRQGRAVFCMLTEGLDLVDKAVDANAVKEAAAVAYLGATDTTASTVLAFVLAMVRYPEVQKKAQEELDRVVGPDRLPDFGDRKALPYVEATIRETYRKYPTAPLGCAHRVEEDDDFEGMAIRKGSTILPVVWSMMRNEESYGPDPDQFNPERFLRNGVINPGREDPRTNAFGFGRRRCPGLHFADATIFIQVVTMLTCFEFGRAIENSVEVTPAERFIPGIVLSPAPFGCSIKPRSDRAVALLEEAHEQLDGQ
ncbi:cytochrome P450 [Auricularia subglabra TFB-10046 SS5]|nr:cytochrome P450 [Auricularia subglabra TFB-10046 SS5]